MRIIGGEFSGFKIKYPKTRHTRPLTEKCREAIFNILNNYLKNTYILDLYAGSGSLGLEALSRGAKKVIFVDQEKICLLIIKRNLKLLNILEKGKLIRDKVEKFLSNNKKKFDIIFLDPPWNNLNLVIFPLLKRSLKNEGLVIFCTSKKNEFLLNTLRDFFIFDKRIYGDHLIVFFKNKK